MSTGENLCHYKDGTTCDYNYNKAAVGGRKVSDDDDDDERVNQ